MAMLSLLALLAGSLGAELPPKRAPKSLFFIDSDLAAVTLPHRSSGVIWGHLGASRLPDIEEIPGLRVDGPNPSGSTMIHLPHSDNHTYNSKCV